MLEARVSCRRFDSRDERPPGRDKMKNKSQENKGNEQKTEPKVTVELTNASGHVSIVLTKAETREVVKRNTGHWIFSGGRLITAAELEKADWSDMAENETTVQLTPGLVGG